MKLQRKHYLSIILATLLMLCLLLPACGRERTDETTTSEVKSTVEQEAKEKAEAEKKASEEKAEAEKKAAEEKAAAEKKEAEEKAAEEQAAEEEKKKEEQSSTKSSSSKKNSSSKSKSKPKEKKKVWVEPVYETRTVTPNTGTRYCNGANSGGGCGSSWHGTKDSTYDSWYSHWQNYVKKRTAEEAAKGNTYVCDHIHDDSRWVPDEPYTEQVLVKDGYWKEVS